MRSVLPYTLKVFISKQEHALIIFNGFAGNGDIKSVNKMF